MSRGKVVLLKDENGTMRFVNFGTMSDLELATLQAHLDHRAISCDAHSYEDRGERLEEATLRAKTFAEVHSKMIDTEFARREREAKIAAGVPLHTPYETELEKQLAAVRRKLEAAESRKADEVGRQERFTRHFKDLVRPLLDHDLYTALVTKADRLADGLPIEET